MQLYGDEFLRWVVRFLITDLCEKDMQNKSVYAKEILSMLEETDLLKYKKNLNSKEKLTYLFFDRLAKQ